MSLGDRVRSARKTEDLSQEGLARRADVSLNVVSRLERGEIVDPHISTLSRIAEALGIPLSELLEESAASKPRFQVRPEIAEKVAGMPLVNLFELRNELIEEQERLVALIPPPPSLQSHLGLDPKPYTPEDKRNLRRLMEVTHELYAVIERLETEAERELSQDTLSREE